MPGAGKSTIGIILAKNLCFGFIDTDVLIQINHQRSLQQLIDESGHMHLRTIEEQEIQRLNIERHVIATGGSAIYSDGAMQHLTSISQIVFLDVKFEEIDRRIRNIGSRGIAKSLDQTFRELFDERQSLYRTYAEQIIQCDKLDQEQLALEIASRLNL